MMPKAEPKTAMSASPAPKKRSGRRPVSAARSPTRSRGKSSVRWQRLPLLLWRLLPLVLVLLAFMAAFTFDPEAVLRLVWACVSGAFGKSMQIAGLVILLCLVTATVWAFRPLPSDHSGEPKSIRRPARRASSGKNASASGPGQREEADAPRRQTRDRTTPEAAAPPEARSPAPKAARASARSRTPANLASEKKTGPRGATR